VVGVEYVTGNDDQVHTLFFGDAYYLIDELYLLRIAASAFERAAEMPV